MPSSGDLVTCGAAFGIDCSEISRLFRDRQESQMMWGVPVEHLVSWNACVTGVCLFARARVCVCVFVSVCVSVCACVRAHACVSACVRMRA